MARLGLDLSAWENDLRWRRLVGLCRRKCRYRPGSVRAVYRIGFLFVMALGINMFSLGMLAVLAYLPYMNLHNAAEKVRSYVRRSLPEAAAFVAGEMAAGVSADQALIRAGRLPGPLGVILREAGEIAGTSNRLMLSKSGVRGVFREQIEVLQMPHLASFAAQADLVAQRGAEGPAQMSSVAKMLAREYRTEVRRGAAELDNKLLLPTTCTSFSPCWLPCSCRWRLGSWACSSNPGLRTVVFIPRSGKSIQSIHEEYKYVQETAFQNVVHCCSGCLAGNRRRSCRCGLRKQRGRLENQRLRKCCQSHGCGRVFGRRYRPTARAITCDRMDVYYAVRGKEIAIFAYDVKNIAAE